MLRVIFSPTTEPIEPPMKLYSIAESITGKPVDRSFDIHDGFQNADFFGSDARLSLYGLFALKFERIGGVQRCVMLGPARIHQEINAFVGRDFVVIAALRANLEIAFKILLPKRFLAAAALDPQAFSNDAPLVR